MRRKKATSAGLPSLDAKAIAALTNKELNRKVSVAIDGVEQRLPLADLIAQQLVRKAVKGDLKAIRMILGLGDQLEEPLPPEPQVPVLSDEEWERLGQRMDASAEAFYQLKRYRAQYGELTDAQMPRIPKFKSVEEFWQGDD